MRSLIELEIQGLRPAAAPGGDPAVSERKTSDDGERNRQVQWELHTHTQLTELSIVTAAGMLAGANINIPVLPLAPSVCKCESHIYHVSVRLPTVMATPFF